MPELKRAISDEEIINFANKEKRVLITNDKDFGEFVFLQKRLMTGVLLLRSFEEKSTYKVSLFKKYFPQIKNKLKGNFIVFTDAGIRSRQIITE